jgi:hypothetical protein
MGAIQVHYIKYYNPLGEIFKMQKRNIEITESIENAENYTGLVFCPKLTNHIPLDSARQDA